MITGIGVDIVEIARFAHWYAYADKKLLRIFTQAEIGYCKSTERKASERFSARFAVREAFYKAFCQATPQHKLPFLTICKALEVSNKPSGAPTLQVTWNRLNCPALLVHMSISHSREQAIAMVILENSAAVR